MTVSEVAYPSDVGMFTVKGTFAMPMGDGSDGDANPDLAPLAGEVICFKPLVDRVRYSGENPLFLVMETVEATVDEGGRLCGADGSPGVRLLASDSESLNPRGWVWEVSFKRRSAKVPPFRIPAVAGSVVDLATFMPVDEENVTARLVDEDAAVRAESAAASVERDLTEVRGAKARVEELIREHGGIPGPQGVQGPQGEPGAPGQNVVNVRSGEPMRLWVGSQSQYDALPSKDPSVLYFVTG